MYVTKVGNPIGLGSWLGEQPASQVDWCLMRQNIAAIARAEEARWTGPNRHKILEGDPSRLPILTSYWAAVPVDNPAANAAQSAAHNDNFPWSAAFICYVMRQAGVLPAHGFPFSQRHISFIVGALRNRERSNLNRPFWLTDSIEIKSEAIPEPGDLLCFNRCAPGRPQDICGGQAGWVLTNHSYESLRARFWDNNIQPTGSSHTAIVVGTTQDGGQRYVETIGGNEDDSVRVRRVPIDQFGGIPNPAANRIFGMIKIVGC